MNLWDWNSNSPKLYEKITEQDRMLFDPLGCLTPTTMKMRLLLHLYQLQSR